MTDFDLIVDTLGDIFGQWKNHNHHSGQISFDCPTCSYDIKGLEDGDGKGNLEINYKKHIYKCWACADTHNTKGRLSYLIRKWGTKQQFKIFNLTNPYNKDKMGNTQEVYEDIKIPQGYRSVAEGSSLSPQYKEAYNYLIKRGITKDMMVKYNLGYTTEGPYSHRIIVPSYDKDGELNYFVARSYVRTKLKYKNPKVQKENIMFNEHTINWNEDIYLVEGVFDMFFLPNAIPLLGKNVSDYMWSMLYEKAKKNIIICLDGDAWESAMILYKKLNGGRLHSRVRLVKLPKDKDIGDLKGNIESLELIELEKD